jgi:4-diphosphocytidyl-2-C-methyl-D-erythritol kinase
LPHRFRSFAKFNLYLAILGKRPDGYHEVDTVLQTVDLSDELQFEPLTESKIEVVCDLPGVPSGPQNLVWQALALLRKRTRVAGGMRVRVRKQIPTQAGLGGGSSNAACALAAGNLLWGTGLRDEQLEQLAAHLGSDVPFFVRGGTQRCRGRGQRLTPVTPLGESQWVIVKPRWNLSTVDVYGHVQTGLTHNVAKVSILLESLAKRDLRTVVAAGFNDLERPAITLQPGATRLTAWMSEAGLTGIRLAGSGSSWVGYCADPQTARQIILDGSNRGWSLWGVRPTGRGWIEG